MRAGRVAALCAAGLALLFLPAAPTAAQELTGTLLKVRASGSITLGYRESSIPFSYLDARGAPIGYAIDLCKEVVDDLAEALDGMTIAVKYRAVTAETRIQALIAGDIDLECGSTTSNFERKKRVAFSPVFFVSGTKLLVKRGAGIASYRDLRGKKVVVTAGTTNAAALKALAEKQHLGITLIAAADHAQSFARLQAGEADAFATDDVLLYGLLATTGSAGDYQVVGDFLSYDPYGLMFRKGDPDFAAVVEHAFARLAASRELVHLYDKWFQQRLPSGERLDLPMSPELEELFRVEGVPE
jgi:glutamate/aspartate transport system substrate-binding protein